MSWQFWASVCQCLALCTINVQSRKKAGTEKEEAAIVFVGDITFDGPVKYFAEVNRTCGYKQPFSKIRKYLQEADITVANMESSLIRKQKKLDVLLPNKIIHHSGRKKATKGLRYAGINLVQLANNHMADLGKDAVFSTVQSLDEAGISHVGLANISKNDGLQEPYIKEVNGIKIGFLAYCWNNEGCNAMHQCQNSGKCKSKHGLYSLGPAIFQNGQTLMEIKSLKQTVDIAVVLMHWGKELATIPSLRVRRVAREISAAGANIVIGTHPHVIQGHECIRPKTLVVYSLGNFLLPKAYSINKNFLVDRKPSKDDIDAYLKKMKNMFNLSQQAYIFRIKVSRKGIAQAEYLPIEIENEEGTNCLQPVPKGNWQDFCELEDLYCYDYRSIYAKSPIEFEEVSNVVAADKDVCVNG